MGGNAALALLLTVGTNLAGIFTMPFVLCWLLDTGSSAVALSPGPLLRSLVKTILLPLLAGAGSRALIPGACSLGEDTIVYVRLHFGSKQTWDTRHTCDAGVPCPLKAHQQCFAWDANFSCLASCANRQTSHLPGVAKAVDGNKKALSLLSACLLALVPWMQISKAVSSDVAVSLGALAAVVASGVVIHLAFLAFNMTAVRVLGIGGRDGEACERFSSLSLHLSKPPFVLL